MENNYLNPAISGKYRVVHTHLPLVLQTPIGNIDFRKLTEDQAEKLIAADFYYLERIPEPVAAPKVKTAAAPPYQSPVIPGTDSQAEPEQEAPAE